MEPNRRTSAALLALALLAMAACGGADQATPRWRIEVLDTRPHTQGAFTQGLDVAGPVLYEGTGKPGQSWVRATDLATGAELARAELPTPLFGEGVAHAGTAVWQLTWQDGIAVERDPATLAERRRVRYEGEGWGLCTRDGTLVMSNGSDTLTFRDPATFDVVGSTRLTAHNEARLNELDCAPDGSVYANNWPTNEILRIDPDSGAVLATIDGSGLLSAAERAGADVLNGIAHLPATDRFLVTGKYWPTVFEVRFVPEG
ncbi:glutaminyl-peptide cyclotransferase [Nocardia sp. NPDC057353]|uniref:glutaminyl-peptide cyclotransferase n=1 Tax=Nocardia sp. NPDC057353 TaxID=3346104 RepID=UPI0036361A1D